VPPPRAAIEPRETQREWTLGERPSRSRGFVGRNVPPPKDGRGDVVVARACRAAIGLGAKLRDFPKAGVDKFPEPSLYTALTARRPPRRDDAPAKLLTDYSVDRRPIILGSVGLRRLFGRPERGTVPVPGCLTGESEERETWTAGVLAGCLFAGGVQPDETSAVLRFRSNTWTITRVIGRVWTSSNVVTMPVSSSHPT